MRFDGMVLWLVLSWVGVMALAVWVAGLLFPPVPAAPRASAQEILRARYARGEITRERYEEALQVLSSRSVGER